MNLCLPISRTLQSEMQTGSTWCPATLQRKTEMQPKAWAVGITTAAGLQTTTFQGSSKKKKKNPLSCVQKSASAEGVGGFLGGD